MHGPLRRYMMLACLMILALGASVPAAGLSWTMQAEGSGLGECSWANYNGSTYVYGGGTGNVYRTSDGDTWFKLSSGPGSYGGYSQLVPFNGKLWMINSNAIRSTYDASGWYYDGSPDWSSGLYFKVVQIGNNLWVYTQNGEMWTSTDAVNYQMSLTKAPWAERVDYELIKFNNVVYLIGGRKPNSSQRFNDVWSTTDGSHWTVTCASAGWSPRSRVAAAVYQSKLWLLGGETSDGVDSNEVWSSTTGATWTRDTGRTPWQPRHGHAAIGRNSTAHGALLYVIGGNAWQHDSSKSGGYTEVASSQLVFASYASGHDAVSSSAKLINVERVSSAAFAVTVKNTGTANWTGAGGYGLKALYDYPDNLCAASNGMTPLPSGVTVRPGQSYTFTVSVNAGDLWGTAYMSLQMYCPNVFYFGDRFDLTINSVPDLTLTWKQLTPLTGFDANRTSQVLVFNGKLWADNQYTTDGFHWTRATSYFKDPWKGRQKPVLGVYKDKLWLVGGEAATNGSILKDAWSSEDGIHWQLETSAAPWSSSQPQQALEWNGKLLVTGQNSTYFTSSDGKTWQTLSSYIYLDQLPLIRFQNALWSLGESGDDADFDSNIYTVSLPNCYHAGNLPFYRRNQAMLSFRDRLWVIGGQDYNYYQYVNTVLCSADGSSWQPSTPLPFGKNDYTAIKGVVYKDRIWLFVWRGGTVQLWVGAPVERMQSSTRLLDLGAQDVQTGYSAPKTMTISNTTGAPLRVRSVSLLGAEGSQYRVRGIAAGQSIPALGSVTIQAAFDPVRLGPTSATLRIAYDGFYSPSHDVSLVGEGTLVSHDARYFNILSYLLGYTKDATGLDLNGDSKVTITDLLRQKTAALKVSSPAAGAEFRMYANQTIRWTPGAAGATVNLALYRNHVFYQKIADGVANSGSYAWLVPYGVIPGGQYTIAVISPSNALAFGESAPFFSIVPVAASIDVIAPDGGERWEIGSSQEIRWSGPSGAAQVRLSLYKGGSYLRSLGDTANDGSFTWVVPGDLAPGCDYHIAVAQSGEPTTRDMSANTFWIVAP